MLEEPIIAPSAYKYGLSREDILHAYRNPLRIWDLGDGFTMMIGPNRAALILEVGYVEGDGDGDRPRHARPETSTSGDDDAPHS